MFEMVNDWYLKYHVKVMLKNYYSMMGINPKDMETKSLTELVEIMKQVLGELQKQNEDYVQTIENQGNVIEGLKHEKEELKKDQFDLRIRNEELYERNERLTQRLSISMQHNVKELKQDKVVGLGR